MSDIQEIQASPELCKFFEKLLELKKYAATEAALTKNADHEAIYMEFYNRLNEIIKEGE